MNSITQDMKFRQSLMNYAKKYGVSRASRKYNKSRSYIYFWLKRWDGNVESLAVKSRRPHHHPNDPIKALCADFNVPYEIISTEIGKILFEARKESNPCALCAKMRKGALNQKALELGCNKIAYAHHKDDLIETALMSLLYEGRFYAFPPVTHLDRTDLTVIRPLMLVSEADVKGFRNKYQLPVCKNPCPMDGHTHREYVKNLIRTLNMDNPGVRERLFHAVINGNFEDWPRLSK